MLNIKIAILIHLLPYFFTLIIAFLPRVTSMIDPRFA